MTCPHCGSGNLRYLEDITNAHRILGERDSVLLIALDPEETLEGSNSECLECRHCLFQYGLPDGIKIEFYDGP